MPHGNRRALPGGFMLCRSHRSPAGLRYYVRKAGAVVRTVVVSVERWSQLERELDERD